MTTISSEIFTSPVDAVGLDPKLLELPTISSIEALVAAVHEAFPVSPPCDDDTVNTPDLVPDDGSSQSSSSPICFLPRSPQCYDYISISPQYSRVDYDPLSTTPSASSAFHSISPRPSDMRLLIKASCAGGKPIKEKGGKYRCSICSRTFSCRYDAKRHTDSAGMKVSCKYCGKLTSRRRGNQLRHLNAKKCLELWEAGYKDGRFTERTVEDAYYS